MMQVLSVYRDYREKGLGFLPTSLHKLDSALRGGLPPSTMTEVPVWMVEQVEVVVSVLLSYKVKWTEKGWSEPRASFTQIYG